MENEFINSFREMSEYIYSYSVAHGFWDDEVIHSQKRNDGEMISLMHSELSELLEGLREGNPKSNKIPEFSSAEEELADLFIRAMDMSKGRGWRIGEAIVEKMKYNMKRPYRHGKEF